MKDCFIYLFFYLSIIAQSYGQDYYVEYNDDIRKAYSLILSLEIEKSHLLLDSIANKQAHNLAVLHLENYADFFTLFVNESLSEFKTLKKNKNLRIKRIENLLSDNDPYKKFVIAEINLQWALARSKFGELFKAGREVLKAYQLLEANKNEYPYFIYNYKSLSVIHSLIETITIPGFMKNILGLEGSIDTGIKEINFVLESNEDFIFQIEAEAIKTFILFYQLNDKATAWSFLTGSGIIKSEYPLALFLVSKIAQRSGRNDLAIELLENRRQSPSAIPFTYLELQLGISKLRKLDVSSRDHILHFLNDFKGQHYIKEAYQKLAWTYLVFEEDKHQYKSILNQISSKGSDLVDDDKQVIYELKSNKPLNSSLLKARLLFDGGYYESALNILNESKSIIRNKTEFVAEYKYRLARTYQALKNKSEAIRQFQYLINTSDKIEKFYRCQSALQLGLIYESESNFKEADFYFNKCLEITSNKYRRSLHQKAKSGLERLKVKR